MTCIIDCEIQFVVLKRMLQSLKSRNIKYIYDIFQKQEHIEFFLQGRQIFVGSYNIQFLSFLACVMQYVCLFAVINTWL